MMAYAPHRSLELRRQVVVASASTSLEVNAPLALGVSATTVPLSRLPASITAPAAAAAFETITGLSLVPVMVMLRDRKSVRVGKAGSVRGTVYHTSRTTLRHV